MGSKPQRTRKKDLTKLKKLLERRASGADDLERFRAMLGCRFDLDSIGRFLWRVERRTLTAWDEALRCGTYDEHPFAGWRAGTPEWSDPIQCFHVATGESSYMTEFCTLRVWISRSLHGTEIDRHGQEFMDEIRQNPPTMSDVFKAVTDHVDHLEAGRQPPLSASRVLAERLSGIRTPNETGWTSVAMIRCATQEASLLECS